MTASEAGWRDDFADQVDDRGRYVRHWRHGSTHRPLVEMHRGPETFDPPFGSGPELLPIIDGEVPVCAVSREQYQAAVLRLAREIIDGLLD